MADEKVPSLRVKVQNIQPDSLGEVAAAMMQEYCLRASPATLNQPTSGDEQLTKAAFGSIVESMLILGSTKLGYGLIDMLGLIERVKFSIVRQVEAQQSRQLYQRAASEVAAAKAKEVADATPAVSS